MNTNTSGELFLKPHLVFSFGAALSSAFSFPKINKRLTKLTTYVDTQTTHKLYKIKYKM